MTKNLLIVIGILCAVIIATGCGKEPVPPKDSGKTQVTTQPIGLQTLDISRVQPISPTGLVMPDTQTSSPVSPTVSATEQSPEKVQLAYRWEKGKTYRYQIIQDSSGQVTAPGFEMKSGGKQTIVVSEEISDVDESGTATIKVVYESLKIKSVSPTGGYFYFDSIKGKNMSKGPEHLSQYFYLIPNQTFSCKIDRRGEISEIKGVDKIIENLGEILREKSDMAYYALTIAYNEETMKAFIQKNHPRLPTTPVAPGEIWEFEESLAFPDFYTLHERVKRTYIGKEQLNGKEYARIDSRHDVTVSFALNPNEQITAERLDHSGLTYFDINNGAMFKQEALYNLNLKFDHSKCESEVFKMNSWVLKVSAINKLIEKVQKEPK